MTTEVPRPLNNLSCSVLKLQTKETLPLGNCCSRTYNGFLLTNKSNSFLWKHESSYMQLPLEVSKLVCLSLPEGARGLLREPSSHWRSIMLISCLPTCAHATPPWNLLCLLFSLFTSHASRCAHLQHPLLKSIQLF